MTGQKHYICGLMLSLAVAFVVSQAPALADALESGIRHYNAGRYRHAVIFLSAAAEQSPDNPLVHYYLANSLVHQDRHDDAKIEYELCYELDPKGPVAGYCLAALKKYGKQVKDLSELPQEDRTRYYKEVRKAGNSGVECKTPVEKAKSVIRRQADYEKKKHRSAGSSYAQRALARAEVRSKRIRENAEAAIDRAMNPPRFIVTATGLVPNPDYGNTELAEAKAKQIRTRMKLDIEEVNKKAKLLAERHQKQSKDKEYVLDEVVANLEDQLDGPTGSSGVKLQAVGTDLYVRYYGHKRSHKEMPDVRPAVVRIINPDGMLGDMDDSGLSQGSSLKQPRKVVKGKVIN